MDIGKVCFEAYFSAIQWDPFNSLFAFCSNIFI